VKPPPRRGEDPANGLNWGNGRRRSGARRFEELPPRARDYVRRLESVVGCEIGVISTSPQRDGTIVRPEGRIEHWLPVRQPVRAQAR